MTAGAWRLRAAAAVLTLTPAAASPAGQSLHEPPPAVARQRSPDLEADAVYAAALKSFAEADYAESRALHEQALTLLERSFGREHPALAPALRTLGNVLNELEDYEGARAAYLRALAILDRQPDPALMARLEANLAKLDLDRGNAAAVVERLDRALARWEGVLGPNHPTMAIIEVNLGVALHQLGELARARTHYERALHSDETRVESAPRVIVTELFDLGSVLREMGDYAGARAQYERARTVADTHLPRQHPSRAYALHNLANLLHQMGDDDGARPLAEESLAILEKVFGPDHRALVNSLQLLGSLSAGLGDPERGMQVVGRALHIAERRPHEAQLAQVLTYLADMKAKAGRWEEVQSDYERALTIYEGVVSPHHPDVAMALKPLAEARLRAGRIAEARELIDRGIGIWQEIDGPHPARADALAFKAQLERADGHRAAALDSALAAEGIARDHFRLTIRTLGEHQALLYAQARARGLDLALSLLATDPALAGRASDVLDAVVRSRGLVSDEMIRRHRVVAEADDQSVRGLATRLAATRDRLAYLAVRTTEGGHREAQRTLLAEARAEKEAAERALAIASLSFREELAGAQLGLAEVRAALPAGSALVSFIRYQREGDGAPCYLAFALDQDRAVPAVVPLGPASLIDPLVQSWRREMSVEASAAGRDERRNLRRYRATGAALRERVWDPVAAALGRRELVYVVPDGPLHLLSLAALPAGAGRFLLEDGPTFQMLSAERDLAPDHAAPGSGILVIGDPEFDRAPPGSGGAGNHPNLRGAWQDCLSRLGPGFSRLPLLSREIGAIEAAWRHAAPVLGSTTTLRGAAASERAFRELAPGRRVVHIATHGFFLQTSCGASGEASATSSTAEGALLRSGIALAGANRWRAVPPDVPDGILTAEEVATLDLRGVDWAVLSACETGVGALAEGEGVFGLRRAFQLAGAHTVVTSLWPVADEAALAFMRSLYRERFALGRPTPEAVRSASRAVLQGQRQRGRSVHPFHWAGFVAVGHDR